MTKKADLDPATVDIVKRLLAMPPKRHDEMKVGRPVKKKKKKRSSKDRASSSKRRSA